MRSDEKLTFGSYEVLQDQKGSNIVLGKGGFGRIYKAKHTLLGRVAALKVIKEESLQAGGRADQDKIEEFKSEARAVARLNHPGIAHIHDCASENGVFYQATEYCEGGTLQEYCEKHGPIPWNLLRPLVIQIAEGLEYAHSNGIIHRDIKPANIMLAKANSLGQVKIIDLGLAKTFVGEVVDSSSTLRSSDAGAGQYTPATASPEQLRANPDEPLDRRTDLFSLGVLVWWLLIGKNPFADLKTAPLYADRLGLSSYDSRLPAELDDEPRELLTGLLEKQRENRIPSAARLLEILTGKPAEQRQGKGVSPQVEGTNIADTEPQALPAPPDHDDGWRAGATLKSSPGAKWYAAQSLDGGVSAIMINAEKSMDPRLLAGLRLSADRRLAMGTFAFVDWRFSGADDVFYLTPPEGCALLSVLRKVGSSRFKDALPFFVHLARSFDAAKSWLGYGIQVDAGDIFVADIHGGFDSEGFNSWNDVDPASARCLPLLEGDGEGSASHEATISTSTQGFPPLARFAALVYRVVSGSAVSHAAFYTDSGYVMASAFSEDGNTLIADTLCNPDPDAPLTHFLQMLAGLEAQPVGDISPLLSPPSANEIVAASLPLIFPENRFAPPAPIAYDATSVDDEIAEMERQLAWKKQEIAEKKAAEEAAALKREQEEAARKQAEAAAAEAARIAAEKQAAVEAAALKAAQEKAAFQAKIREETKVAAERAERERERDLLREQVERENQEKLIAQQKAKAEKDAAARLEAQEKQEAEAAAAEKERLRIAQLEEDHRKKEAKFAAEKAERERQAALVAIKKTEENAAEARAAAINEEERREKAARKAVSNSVRVEKRSGSGVSVTKKILITCFILVIFAIASAFFFIGGDDKPDDVVKNELPQMARPPNGDQVASVPKPEPVPMFPIPPDEPKMAIVRFNMPAVGAAEPGIRCDSFQLTAVAGTGEKYVSSNGTLDIKSDPGAAYKLTLLGTVDNKKDTPLASRLVKLPGQASETPLQVNVPASLPAIVIDNPHDRADYSVVSVSPPPGTPSEPTEENAADLSEIKPDIPGKIEILKFTPENSLLELAKREIPAKGQPVYFPVVNNGKWTVRYSGSQLGDRVEKISVEGTNPTLRKTVPKPYSGTYSIVVPMTKFPSEAERNKIQKTETSDDGSPMKIPYFNEMVYVSNDRYTQTRKDWIKVLGAQELPHYIGIIVNLNLSTKHVQSISNVKILRIYPHMEVFHSDCNLITVSQGDNDSITLDLMSPKGFAGGYTLPGTKEWAEQMVKFTTDAQYNEIHPFIRNSVSKWIDYFSAESIQKAEIAPVSMNFKDWKMVDYIENFSLVLKLEGENLYLASLAQVFEKENLYKNSSKDIGVPESIEAVFFENSSISKRIIFNKLN